MSSWVFFDVKTLRQAGQVNRACLDAFFSQSVLTEQFYEGDASALSFFL